MRRKRSDYGEIVRDADQRGAGQGQAQRAHASKAERLRGNCPRRGPTSACRWWSTWMSSGSRVSCARQEAPGRHQFLMAGLSSLGRRTGGRSAVQELKVRMTLSRRGVDSNFQYAEAVKLVVAPFSCADCFGRVSEPVDVPARACRPMRARSTSPPDGSPPAARTASTSWRSRKRRATPNLPDVITRARRRRL
jgi:hypothetical protein